MCSIDSRCFHATWEHGDIPTPSILHNVTCYVFGCPPNGFCLLWDNQETNFQTTKEGGSHGSVHICIYGFTLEKSFTLAKPRHLKNPVSRQNQNRSCSGSLVFVMVVHIELWNFKILHSMEIALDLDCKNEWYMNKRLTKYHSVLHSKVTLNLPSKYIALPTPPPLTKDLCLICFTANYSFLLKPAWPCGPVSLLHSIAELVWSKPKGLFLCPSRVNGDYLWSVFHEN